MTDPDLWAEAGDDRALRDQCRFRCPRRTECARDALAIGAAAGIWAGIYIPPDDPDSSRHDQTRAQAYARHRLKVIAGLSDGVPLTEPEETPVDHLPPEPVDEQPRPNGAFGDIYTELREHCGYAEWQIAKRLRVNNLSLLRQLNRYGIPPRPEFLTMCSQERREQ